MWVVSWRKRRFLGLVGIAVLVAACSTEADPSSTGSGEDDLRFRSTSIDMSLPEVDALGYEIDLNVNDTPGHETYSADVKGTYVATKNLTELTLDFDGNTIDSVTVSGRPAEHRRDGARLIIKLPTRVEATRTFSTRITYHGEPRQADGSDPNDFAAFGGFMVKQRNSENKRIYTTLSWPSKTRRWLPLRDHPRDTAMVAITATFPKAFTVLANGKKVGADENADGSKTWRYEALTPMPTYDFHVSAYENWKVDDARSSSGVPITTYTYAGTHARARSIYGDLPKVMDFYETTFGKYHWGSATFIQEPIFGGGMEHASVISMDETLFPDPKEARTTSFHELAHHWSGNSVHFRTWNDFWLSEGFTEYLTARAVTHVDGPEAGKKVWRGYLTEVLDADKTNPHPLAPPNGREEIDVLTIFDAIPYQKGALTVRLLEHIVGPEKMGTFLKKWFGTHGLSHAVTTDDLQKELSEASGKDLKPFFDTMVREGFHPELKVTFAPSAGASQTPAVRGETEIKVEQLQDQGPRGGFLFPIDLDLVDEGGQSTRVTIDLTGKTTTKRVPTPRPLRSIVVDPEEHALTAVTSCGQSAGTTADCKADYRCAPQRVGISVCVPR